MHTPSAEQQAIVDAVKAGRNVVVDAVAGSGKTTTVLFLAAACQNKRVLQITYNSQLKSEVREKAAARGLVNLEVHTYHSLIVRYYDNNGFTDAVMRRVVSGNKQPRILPQVDILVIDEAQDMTTLYYKVIRKMLDDVQSPVTLLIMGDRYQGIYDFKDADTRFLTLAKRIWPVRANNAVNAERESDNAASDSDNADNAASDSESDDDPEPFLSLTLRRTYRLTDPITNFVNNCLVGSKRIVSCKPGPPIQYLKYDVWTVHKYLTDMILSLIHHKQAAPEDIFVLAGSVKNASSPLRMLENSLVKNRIPCFVPTNENAVLDEEIITGKVIFTTFHQSTGRERPIVIVYGFDESYFKFFAPDSSRKTCPSTIYVATTRASQRLIVVEAANDTPLPFLKCPPRNMHRLTSITYVEMTPGGRPPKIANAYQDADADGIAHKTTPTELTRFMSLASVDILSAIVDRTFKCVAEPSTSTRIPSKIRTVREPELYEEVSDLNGLVIPAIFEAKKTAITTLHKYLSNEQACIEHDHPFLSDAIDAVAFPCETLAEYLYMGNVYTAVRDRLYFKLAQIKPSQYVWLTEQMVEECHRHMEQHLGKDVVYERELGDAVTDVTGHVTYVHKFDFGRIQFKSRVDAVDDAFVWELKCVAALQLEHQLQLMVYAWIWAKSMQDAEGHRRFRLMNIRTGEVQEMTASAEELDEVMDVLLRNKYGKQRTKTDDEFVEELNPTTPILM
jgi:hypothetical protein